MSEADMQESRRFPIIADCGAAWVPHQAPAQPQEHMPQLPWDFDTQLAFTFREPSGDGLKASAGMSEEARARLFAFSFYETHPTNWRALAAFWPGLRDTLIEDGHLNEEDNLEQLGRGIAQWEIHIASEDRMYVLGLLAGLLPAEAQPRIES